MKYFQDQLSSLIDDIQKKKMAVFYDKLKERGIEFDLEKESNRRFKSFMIETHTDGREIYYYNDGSIQGLRIVTFVTQQPDLSSTNLWFSYSYY